MKRSGASKKVVEVATVQEQQKRERDAQRAATSDETMTVDWSTEQDGTVQVTTVDKWGQQTVSRWASSGARAVVMMTGSSSKEGSTETVVTRKWMS